MTAIERIRQAAKQAYEQEAKEIAKSTGKTVEEAKELMEIANNIEIEHEQLTYTPY